MVKKLGLTISVLIVIAIVAYLLVINLPSSDVLDNNTTLNSSNLSYIPEPLSFEEKYEHEFETPQYVLCKAITSDDLSVCEANRSMEGFDSDDEYNMFVSECKRDTEIFNLRPGDCDSVQDPVIKDLCISKWNKEVDHCSEDLMPICKSLSEKNPDLCNEYGSESDILDCNNLNVMFNIYDTSDCSKLSSHSDDGILWETICLAEIKQDVSYCNNLVSLIASENE